MKGLFLLRKRILLASGKKQEAMNERNRAKLQMQLLCILCLTLNNFYQFVMKKDTQKCYNKRGLNEAYFWIFFYGFAPAKNTPRLSSFSRGISVMYYFVGQTLVHIQVFGLSTSPIKLWSPMSELRASFSFHLFPTNLGQQCPYARNWVLC